MGKKLLSMTIFAMAVVIVSAIVLINSDKQSNYDEKQELNIVELNQIKHDYKDGNVEEAERRIDALQSEMRNSTEKNNSINVAVVYSGITILYITIMFLYLYFAIFRPFSKMEKYANELAQGNFDIALDYERSNYFGNLTWAFDSMRREITKARACEKEAIENNKTVIATLSHDIKTPISSIRAYCEGLDANLDSKPESRSRYLNVIMNKCDEVSKLTNDLFIHSISDLEKIKVETSEIEIASCVEKIIEEIAAEKGDVNFTKPMFKAYIMADEKRVTQVCENIINNARKYAKSSIDISMSETSDEVIINFRDHGSGIPDEDMPFIFDKFYRGKNSADEQGSGLGLFIVKYLVEQMKGSVELINHGNGLEVVVRLVK